MRVFVYFNLHKKMWSVKALSGPNKGRVIAHSDTVQLRNAIGRVSEAGRQRVIKEQRKNVHAGIVGELVSFDVHSGFHGEALTYNPYKYSSFIFRATEKPFTEMAAMAYLHNRKVFVK